MRVKDSQPRDPAEADPKQTEAVDAALRIMEELARWMLETAGITCPLARDLMKIAYARAGCALVPPLPNGQVNNSKVADVTDLFRQEIPSLLKVSPDPKALKRRRYQQRIQRIMDAWRRYYIETDGSPSVLPVRGPRRSFEALCKSHGGGTRFEALLSLLEDNAAVQRLPDGRVKLLRKRFATGRIDPAGISDFGNEIAEHIRTACDNAARSEEDSLLALRIESGYLDGDDPNIVERLKNNIAGRVRALADSTELELNDPGYRAKAGKSRRKLVLVTYLAESDQTPRRSRRVYQSSAADAKGNTRTPDVGPLSTSRRRPRKK